MRALALTAAILLACTLTACTRPITFEGTGTITPAPAKQAKVTTPSSD
jgi:hypothetical protein